jgi:hypothetical protein
VPGMMTQWGAVNTTMATVSSGETFLVTESSAPAWHSSFGFSRRVICGCKGPENCSHSRRTRGRSLAEVFWQLSRDEPQGRRVHAVAETGRFRAIVEDVSQMCVAFGA